MKNKIITIFIFLLITSSILGVTYKGVVFQEDNAISLITSIVKLEFSNKDYLEYQPNTFISEFEPGVERYNVVITYMKEEGWLFKELVGSSIVFKKGEEVLIVSTRLLSKHYYIWKIPL